MSDQQDDVQAAQQRAEAAEARAQQLETQARQERLRSEFQARARGAGMTDEQARDAFDLAAYRGKLDGVDVDLESGAVRGIDPVVREAAKDLPYEQRIKPAVDNHHAAGGGGTGHSLKNFQPGDWTRLREENPELADRYMKEGVRIPTGRHVRNERGQLVKEYFQVGGQDDGSERMMDARRRYKRAQRRYIGDED